MNVLGDWNIFEILWTLLSLIGLYYCIINFKESLKDLQAAMPVGNGRRLLAMSNARRDAVRIYLMSCLVLVGAIGGLTQQREPSNIVGAFWIMTLPALLMLDSILDRKDRRVTLQAGIRKFDPDHPEL